MIIKKPIFITLIILIVILAGVSAYFYLLYSQIKENPQQIVQEEVDSLIRRVSRLIVLPEGETPTVATVSDPDKLIGQPFFAKAKLGDKVLIFPNSKKAILYDPLSDIILEVAPINIGQ